MGAPWEDYGTHDGPWQDYAAPKAAPADDTPPAAPPGQVFVGWGYDSGDNNRRYPMFGPDEATKKIDALPYMSRPGLTDKVVHGMLLGVDNEAAGLIGGVTSAVTGKPFGEGYHQGREEYQQRFDYVSNKHPILAPVAELGGAILNPVGAIGDGIKGMAAGGAVIGGVHGFEDNNGTVGQRLTNAGVEGAAGAVLAPVIGKAVEYGVKGAGKVVQAAKRVTGRDPSVGARLVANKLAEDNLVPADAAAAMEQAQATGTPAVLADLGENVRALGGSVSRQPGAARTMAKAATADRQLGQGERIKDAINRDLGHTTDTLEESARLMKEAKDRARPLYQKFHAEPAKTSPLIERLIGTPAGRKALARAAEIAQNEGESLSTLGFEVGKDGSVTLNPVRPDLHAGLAKARSEFDAAQAELAAAKRQVLGGGGATRVQAANERIAKAQDILDAAKSGLSASPSEGTAQVRNVYKSKTIDYIKQGIDDVLEAQPRHPHTGKIILDRGTQAIEGVRKRFVEEADRLWPTTYKAARDAYAGPSKLRDAMEEGKKALNKSAAEINQRLGNMSKVEHEQYALGLRSAIADKLDAAGDNANKVRQLIGNPKKRAALQRAFGGKANLDRFFSTLSNEQAAFDTYASVQRGSETAGRQIEDGNNSDLKLLKGAFQDGSDIIGGGHLGIAAVAARRVGDAIKFGVGKAGKSAREDAASLLFSSNPSEFRNALAEMNERVATRNLNLNALADITRRRGAQVGAAGGANATNAFLRRHPPK